MEVGLFGRGEIEGIGIQWKGNVARQVAIASGEMYPDPVIGISKRVSSDK